MAEIRRKTTPPVGCFLVAREGDAFAGCASFRALSAGACEVHDVWVPPAFRGRGLGVRLVAALVDEARRAGYTLMRLETATFMGHAHAVYAAQGFRPCAHYRSLPAKYAAITISMERALGS